jgi:hypothetical protein
MFKSLAFIGVILFILLHFNIVIIMDVQLPEDANELNTLHLYMI